MDNNCVESPKKILTDEIIKKALLFTRKSFEAYSDGIVIVVVSVVLVALGSGMGLLFLPFGIWKIFKNIYVDVLKTIGRYYVLEASCIDGVYHIYEDKPTEYSLLFKKGKGKKPVYVKISKAIFDDFNVGDECYVVFIKGLKNPCLCYKKSEWTR